MDTAKCLEDDKEYGILEFQQLEPTKILALRHNLICTACQKPAYFRKRSIDGKKACFGAHHEEACDLATTYKTILSNQEIRKVEEFVNQIEASKNELILDLTAKKIRSLSSTKIDSSGPKEVVIEKSKKHVNTPTIEKVPSHRILSVLKILIADKEFPKSDYKLYPSFIESSSGFKAKDIFVNFEKVSDYHLKKWKGFWGILSGAGFGKGGTLWLNTGGIENNKLSIVLSDDIKNDLRSKFSYNIDDDFQESFSGAYFLIFFKMKESSNGKFYIDGAKGSFAIITQDGKKYEYIRS